MALTFAAVLVSSVLLVMSASLSKTLRHKPPNECEWLAVTAYGDETIVSQTVSDEQEVALHCKVRTMNSELEKTNFSIIQPQYTVKLRIECNNQLYLLSSLGVGTFQTLVDLKELTIDSCKLNSLARESFRGLRQLRNLTVVTHNTDWTTSVNMEVQSDTFLEELNMLERLDLSHNNMVKLPEGVFCSLQNLVYLNLTRNRLRHLELFHFGSSGQHKCGANLQVLDLSHNNFDSINSQVFAHLSDLQELYLQDNAISVIGDHGFDGLAALSVLNVASNRLVNLAPELFADARELREMYLQNNTINVLAPGLFNELSRLLVLDLSENQLTEEWVNAATFTGLVHLVFLSLSNNNITKLDTMIFRDLYRLRSLRLDNNGVQYLPENVFSSLIDMRTLVLSSNKLTRIDQFTFDGLPSLNQLSLDNNQIQYIDPEALRNSTDLEYLHLNGNKLYDIPAVLNNVPNLKTLDLGYNQITDIFNTSFPAMSQLIGLKLLKNQISNVSKGVFDRLPELHLINLANNKIQKIEPGTFDNNTRLVAVRVDGNYLRDVGGLFSKLSNLVWLNISENFLEWFDYALIPTGLQWLDVHGNQITELGNHYELETQLTGFDASNNKLTEVTGSSIPDKVQNLYLSNNQISKIQSYAFFKKPNLTQVDLTGNRLKTLNPQSLRISTVPAGRPMPQFLVGNNPFVCDCSMQWLQTYSVEPDRNKPKLIDLETATCEVIYNRGDSRVLLKEASEEQFLCQYDMECAKRSTCDCCDYDACDCKMICPTNCTCFHSVSSTSNVVDCSSAGYVNRVPDKIPMNTTVLYLDGNTVKTLSTHAFLGRKILKILYLNSSNVERVQNRTFHGLKELEVLHLDDNRISALYGDEFYGLDKLKELYLDHNRITYVNSTTFRFLQQLTVLRLDHNRIAQFPVWRLSPTLTRLALAENQWSCACDFVQQMKEFLQYAADTVVDAEQIRCLDHAGGFNVFSDNGTVCGPTTPSLSAAEKSFNGSSNTIEGALNGGNLTAPTKTVVLQKTDIQDYIPILIVSFSAVFFIVVAAMMVYVFRHEMKVWCHSRFGVRIFCKSTEFEMNERDKLFDAFVSYSSKDEAFVIEELAPILENGDPSYKLCLHYREFPAGGYISDTIVQAVESSKRTIMVLSENFIKSEWCRFEFKSAHHQVLRDKRKRLIVILLGEVPNKDLDPDIRLYLKTNSYLQWGDKHFWEKLKFALPDVPNNQRPKTINHKHHHHHHHHHRGVHNNYSRPLAIHI